MRELQKLNRSILNSNNKNKPLELLIAPTRPSEVSFLFLPPLQLGMATTSP